MSIYNLRRALVSLYNADSQVRAITGRTSENLKYRGDLHAALKPVTTYFIVVGRVPGGTDQRREVTVQLDAWTNQEDNTTIGDLTTLLARAEALFTASNLLAQTPSVDAAVFIGDVRDNFPDKDGMISLGQDFTFLVAV